MYTASFYLMLSEALIKNNSINLKEFIEAMTYSIHGHYKMLFKFIILFVLYLFSEYAYILFVYSFQAPHFHVWVCTMRLQEMSLCLQRKMVISVFRVLLLFCKSLFVHYDALKVI